MSAYQRVLIDDLELDASLSERHKDLAEITKHPVEEGADVTDHVRVLPVGLTIDGLISNTPVNLQESKDDGRTAIGENGRAQDGYAKLRAILRKGQTITIATALRTYENMLLVSIEVPADSKMGDALRFTASFEEVRFVRTESVRLEVLTDPNRVPTKPIKKKDQGTKPTEEKKGNKLDGILKGALNSSGVTKQDSGKINIPVDE